MLLYVTSVSPEPGTSDTWLGLKVPLPSFLPCCLSHLALFHMEEMCTFLPPIQNQLLSPVIAS